jgi:prepilin-type N-terminal cleavage/methylation domain-containing protein
MKYIIAIPTANGQRPTANGQRRTSLNVSKFHFLKNSAFTLIELLVVVLIIGILAAIALPRYQRTVEKSRFTKVKQNLVTLYQSAKRYQLLTGSFPTLIEELDISFSGETLKKLVNIGGVPIDSSQVKVDNFTYGVVNSDRAWQNAPLKMVYAAYTYKNCMLLIGTFGNQEGTYCHCPMGETAEKYCGEILQGTVRSGNQAGYAVYLIP